MHENGENVFCRAQEERERKKILTKADQVGITRNAIKQCFVFTYNTIPRYKINNKIREEKKIK